MTKRCDSEMQGEDRRHENELVTFLEQQKKDHEERFFFAQLDLGSEVNWFFTQGLGALKQELYLPASASFIIGIEASLRVTQAQIVKNGIVDELPPEKTLSNRLLNEAGMNGLPVHLLAFSTEINFNEKLATKKTEKIDVEIVRVRHNFCHGNILEYRNSELGKDLIFFTPECLLDLTHELYNISKKWLTALDEFRRERFPCTKVLPTNELTSAKLEN